MSLSIVIFVRHLAIFNSSHKIIVYNIDNLKRRRKMCLYFFTRERAEKFIQDRLRGDKKIVLFTRKWIMMLISNYY